MEKSIKEGMKKGVEPKETVQNSMPKHSCGGHYEYKDREGYVCNKCYHTRLFLPVINPSLK